MAWQPDQNALHIDAFTFNWEGKNLFIFPPFSMMASVVHKLQLTPNVTGILVYPVWPTQPWFPIVQNLVSKTTNLPKNCVTNPVDPQENMPIKLRLRAGRF